MENIEVAIVEKAKIISCMKCPICNKLYREATTISECLHTFCRKCIYEKLEHEEEDSCPVCDTYLGVTPLEKLRADHNLDDIREKIFPSRGSRGEPSAAQPLVKTEPIEVQMANIVLPEAEPSVVEPPVLQLPKVEPTEGEPSAVEPPPSFQLSKIELIEAEPSAVEPPMADASVVEPPLVQPTDAEPPEVEMAEAELPQAQNPEAEVAAAKTPENENHDAELAVSVPERINERPVSTNSPSMARRSRIKTRNVAQPVEESTKNQEQNSSKEHLHTSCSNDNQNHSSAVEPTNDPHLNQETEEGVEGNADLHEPLSRLVEYANRNKNKRVLSEGSGEKIASRSEAEALKMKGKEPPELDAKNNAKAGQASTSTPKKAKRNRKKNSTASEEPVVSPQRNIPTWLGPIWLSLVAAEDQEGDDPLLQLPAKFLRIKNGDLNVSFLKKYFVKKFDLQSEEEIEIRCCNKKLYPELKLRSLLDIWIQSGPGDKRVEVTPGSSVEEFVMVLTYGRKGTSPQTESESDA